MIFTEQRTKKEWFMTAQQAKELAKELNYIADEANDHQHTYYSQVITDGGLEDCKEPLRIVAIPDSTKKEYDIELYVKIKPVEEGIYYYMGDKYWQYPVIVSVFKKKSKLYVKFEGGNTIKVKDTPPDSLWQIKRE